MASWGVYLLSLTLICNIIARCDFSFVNLKCNDYKQGRLGQQSLLECIVNLSQEASDARIERVFWRKEGATLIEYERGNAPKSEPRFTLAEPYWNEGNLNVSMLVTNTMVGDVGNYTCHVITNRGYCLSSASLELSATYSSPTIGGTEKEVTTPSQNDGSSEQTIGSQLASKVVPSVVAVLVIIGLLFFLRKRCAKQVRIKKFLRRTNIHVMANQTMSEGLGQTVVY